MWDFVRSAFLRNRSRDFIANLTSLLNHGLSDCLKVIVLVGICLRAIDSNSEVNNSMLHTTVLLHKLFSQFLFFMSFLNPLTSALLYIPYFLL